MTQTEINKYKAMLEAKQAELSAGLRNREDIAIEKTPDAIDEVQLAGERELAIRNLDRESNLLRNVKGALVRIADGSYGVCMHCEEDIKIKRLDAVPWTRYCIRSWNPPHGLSALRGGPSGPLSDIRCSPAGA